MHAMGVPFDGSLWLGVLFFVLLGAAAGFLSGLLGLGGGVVVVPGLLVVLSYLGIRQDVLMHLAAGTSLAVMIPATIRSLVAHSRYPVIFIPIFKKLIFPVVLGAFLGAYLGRTLHSDLLTDIFGAFILFTGCKMLFSTKRLRKEATLGPKVSLVVGLLVGALSGMLGIGGGSIMIPALNYAGIDIRRAVMLSLAVSLTAAIVGTLSVVISGWSAPGLPTWTTGYVFWPAWIAVTFGSFSLIPVGVMLSHRVPILFLRRVFACVLLLVGVHLFIHF